jgi:glycosyltransferase involved in cell wall biosynthesis
LLGEREPVAGARLNPPECSTMAKRKILYIAHNHPAVRPGGAEAYAFELYQAMQGSDRFEPTFLARSGPPVSSIPRYHEGTLLTAVNDDPNQYFFYTDVTHYDWLHGKSPNKSILTRYFRDFLLATQPDIVHFQHSLFLGFDALRLTRNTLPGVPIVYTLHEYLPICHNNGQMVRTKNDELCLEESPRRCHECFPQISAPEFFLRKQFVLSHFEEVDLFLAPSNFLLNRYVDWGIPPEKIRFEDYGRLPPKRVTAVDEADYRPRNRFSFFGQLSHFKGVNVALKAMKILTEDEDSEAHLWVHGANLDLQPQGFIDEFESLLEATEGHVTYSGIYDHDDLPKLLSDTDWVVVPSLWWENSPLVIQEAFLHGRPVICSDIGGMAEKVTHEVNGLHFRVRNPDDLAETIKRAGTTPGLWEKLKEGIPRIYSMDDHIESLSNIYEALSSRVPRRRAGALRT